jgi:lipopolysaccharide/colanic/teichoic acid biosynthesis glycosyltransferase
VKRFIDVSLGLVATMVTLPFVLLLAVALAVHLRAWPFFVQHRVGLGGRLIRVVKLRTLPLSTPTEMDKYALRDVPVTPFAARLRRLHLDELPQLWLVVRGTMSLVGPRPEMPSLHARFDPPVAEERTRVKPGCTGLWQVSTAASGLMHENPQYDLAYVRTQSLRLDFWILWHTARVLLTGRRTVTLDALPLLHGAHEPSLRPRERPVEDAAG